MEAITQYKQKQDSSLIQAERSSRHSKYLINIYEKPTQSIPSFWQSREIESIIGSVFNPKIKLLDTNSDYILIQIDNKKHSLPDALQPLNQQLQEAEEILAYEDDWDDEGAMATNQQTFDNACTFVLDYALYLYKIYSSVLKIPYIDILRDGSVSVFWEEEKAQLLVIFKKDSFDLAHYYAESSEKKIPLKSAVVPGAPVDEMLALWMMKNLT